MQQQAGRTLLLSSAPSGCMKEASRFSAQINTANVSHRIARKLANGEPYIHKLAGRCQFTLKMPGNMSSDEVPLTAGSTDMLVEQICQDLDCGSVYEVTKTSLPHNTTCFDHCLHQDGRLQNCSQSKGSDCVTITGAVCGHQAVRLVGGADRCAGRVELWRDGRWGTVCDDQWDLQDANVVCAQLGCGYALEVTGQGGSFPPGRGPVYLDELNCTGREENLWACPDAQDEPDCGHKEDAGVVCSEMRAVRLAGGLDRCSGKVEVHRNGSWGTVCDHCWNKNLASMVCSMLHCGAQAVKMSQFVPPLLHNNGTLWYYSCNPGAQDLWQCVEYNIPHLCLSSKASGVICNGSLGFPTPTTASTANATTGWTTAFLIQQTRTSSRPSSEQHHKNYQDAAVNLIKVTTNPAQTDDTEPKEEVMGVFSSYNGNPADQYARVSKISVDSFDSSSTSSGECYENTNNYVTPEPGPSQSYTVNEPGGFPSGYRNNQQTTDQHWLNPAEVDDGIYSPVSPDQDPSSDDDYDDIGA
ncbi:T-cell differentiation antigen CD6 [Collichthys lucidus]|uniref:T-cell differentiation antigen CD6 n=1 Tax=Collichthys lucidus TaxID=240159 RepID=A0A4U5VMN3_COLLU|nr:T-cell differentiation antigen CD6 [Collichthys lucidus]